PNQASCRWRYDEPFLKTAGGGEVLLGWACLNSCELAAYSRRAAALLRREPAKRPQPVVLLAPRERRYLDLLDELEGTAPPSGNFKVFRWSAERIRRARLMDALRLGASALLYTGHGNHDGWFAYGGLSTESLVSGAEWEVGETNGLLFSLSCRTGQP